MKKVAPPASTSLKEIHQLLESKFDSFEKKFEETLDIKFEAFGKVMRLDTRIVVAEAVEKLDRKAKQYRSDVLDGLDEVIGELETMRQENTVGSEQGRELQETIKQHEKRIRKLEKFQQAA